MPKKIIFCAEGTWNGPANLDTKAEAQAPKPAAVGFADDLINVQKHCPTGRDHFSLRAHKGK